MAADRRGAFLEFLRGIELATEESLEGSYELVSARPEVAEEFAETSPKFVEIFSRLRAGESKDRVACAFYKIISGLFDALTPKATTFFRGLHYLADTIIRRHLSNLYAMMNRKRGELAVHLLVQVASVDSNHCRDLFHALNFGNTEDASSRYFRNQCEGDGRAEYIKLTTLFLRNPEVSWQCLGTKYYISGMWDKLASDKHNVAKGFLEAMIDAMGTVNTNTKRWVFGERVLRSIAKYPFDSTEDKTAEHAMYRLVEIVLTGPNSILVEDPIRLYCRDFRDLDIPPKNSDLLGFVKELDPWKNPNHRAMTLLVFQRSPDLIARYLGGLNRAIPISVTLPTTSALVFLGSIIGLDWPDFIGDIDFSNDNRSQEMLFESILPSVLKNSTVSMFLKQPAILLRREMMVILSKALLKFMKLPEDLKRSGLYTRLRGRLAAVEWSLLIEASSSVTLFPFAVKLFMLMDRVFPFFVADSTGNDPKFMKTIDTAVPICQLEIMRIIPLLPAKLLITKIPVLCALILNAEQELHIRQSALTCLKTVLEKTDLFEGHEYEIPILIGVALEENAAKALNDIVVLAKGSRLRYTENPQLSPVLNAVNEKNTLFRAKCIVEAMLESNQIGSLDLSPVNTMMKMKWFSLEVTVVLLCTSIANGTADLAFALVCLTAAVAFDTVRTIPYVLNNAYIRGVTFCGSENLDNTISMFIEKNKGCDEGMINRFLDGTVTPDVAIRVAPFVPREFSGRLIKKFMTMHLPIRNIIRASTPATIPTLDVFWTWVFEGYEPIDLSLLDAGLCRKISDEQLLLDILRTMWLLKDATLLPGISIPDTDNERLLVMAADMSVNMSGRRSQHQESVALCFVTRTNVSDPLRAFEATRDEWGFDFLLEQIRDAPFEREAGKLSRSKVRAVCSFFLEKGGGFIGITFKTHIVRYIIKHPEVVTKPPERSAIFDEVTKELCNPSYLLSFNRTQLEGVVNTILGSTTVHLPLRIVLYFATELADYASFYSMLERNRITASSFLFVTGDVAKVTIQTLDSNQKIVPSGLVRNTAYLAPFRGAHQRVPVDTPMFRFMLHFANHLLTEAVVPLDVFMDSGALAVIMRALSSTDSHTRAVAYSSLSSLYDHNLKNKEWSYHSELGLLLESLLNAVDKPCLRFTSLISYFLACTSSIIVRPGHAIFIAVVKFLASAPALRCSSVPLFSDLFGTDSQDYRSERTYVLKMMKTGIVEATDVELMTKGRIAERLMGFFASPLADRSTRDLVIDVLLAASALAKVDNVILWIYSVLTETFAVEHADRLVALALSMRDPSSAECECRQMIARQAQTRFQSRLSPTTTALVNAVV